MKTNTTTLQRSKSFLTAVALLAFVSFSGLVFAQGQTVSGVITSAEDNTPLPGANLLIKGTTTGTATAPDGTFELTVPDGNVTLVISYIGFTKQEVKLDGRKTLAIALVVKIMSFIRSASCITWPIPQGA